MAFTYFHEPKTIEEASAILIENGEKAVLWAGGTSLVKRRFGAIEHIVSLASLDLRAIEGNVIGAMATLSELIEWNTEYKGGQLLQDAAKSTASSFLRNMATVGGSSLICFRWSDLVAPLLAIDALFSFYSIQGNREILAAELYDSSHPLRKLRQGEIMTSLSVPSAVAAHAFTKYGITTFSYAIWDVAVVLLAGEYRVAVSAGTNFPLRLKRVEELMNEGPISLAAIQRAIEAAIQCNELRVTSSSGFPAEYRRKVLPTLILDTYEKMQGGGQRD